ncbi:lysoplasmalogenase-like protein TMEM86A [Pristis pectinata]|uniref:lysoplasmalogenase-like protein TMEM86A n=1 Tax=Pristis pectinata TaxID=685728 RepID=UPI00223DAEAF|nr:lysoplasmalogenase-like protein TMEM86A [Pristis pectinata]
MPATPHVAAGEAGHPICPTDQPKSNGPIIQQNPAVIGNAGVHPRAHLCGNALSSGSLTWTTHGPTSPRSPGMAPQWAKSAGPKLIPFVISSCIYFVLWLPTSSPSWFSALIKCLPVLCLAFFILAHGWSVGTIHPYSKKIFVGFLFSALGDVFLTWGDQGFFNHGVLTFGIGHVFYMVAFGLHPLRLGVALVLLLLGAALYTVIYQCVDGPTLYALGGYSITLTLMSWRAIARARCSGYERTWGSLCTAAGAVIFIVSDFMLAVDRFCVPLPHARLTVMSTYYLAQMLISLSVLDHTDRDSLWKMH